MKHINIICCAFAFGGLLCSCSNKSNNEDRVQEFALKLATQAEANRKDSVIMVYPDAAKADSLALKFSPENIAVAKSDEPDTYEVTLTPGVKIWIKNTSDGKMQVVKSRGLFAYNDEKIADAKSLGAYNQDLTDAQLAVRMALIPEIKANVSAKFVADFKNNVRVGNSKIIKDIEFMMDEGKIMVTIINNNPVEVSGSDYTLSYKMETSYAGMAEPEVFTRTVGGNNIPANGNTGIIQYFSGHTYPIDGKDKIVWKISDERIIEKYYTPTGKEYDEYIKTLGTNNSGCK